MFEASTKGTKSKLHLNENKFQTVVCYLELNILNQKPKMHEKYVCYELGKETIKLGFLTNSQALVTEPHLIKCITLQVSTKKLIGSIL